METKKTSHKLHEGETSGKKSSEDDSASSFKLNKEHCLNIFNSIKCFSERVASPERKKYISSLEEINEKDEEQVRFIRNRAASTTDLNDKLAETAPETLKDIFKISNRNRKRNKQKKKNKGG